jgi:hypothetical protein
MKVKVNVKVASNLKSSQTAQVGQTVEFVAKENDSVQALKAKIMESHMIAFHQQDLTLDGKVLPESEPLCECGVHEGSVVELAVRTSEATLLSSLVEVLSERDLSLEELALLYCYKHGVSINQVLQSIGIQEKFSNFVNRHSEFNFRGGRVSLNRGSVTPPAPGLSLASPVESGRSYAAAAAGAAKHVATADKSDAVTGAGACAYLELHTKISGRAFSSKATQVLNEITTTVSENLFLNIDHVVRGGSVGRGTVIGGTTDAELVFFLKDLPVAGGMRWLPALHKAVVGVLNEHLGASHGVEQVHATADSVKLIVRGVVAVDLKFVPVFDSYAGMLSAMSEEGPETRRRLGAALMKERTHFIAKQPGQVKVTMRLLKWWRDQQQWTGANTKPSDDLIELLTVHSAQQSKPQDQQTAVANVLALMKRFDELNITWTNFYKKSEIWEPLVNQRPLIMDPVNPYLNLADPQAFDPRDLMSFASQTRFFW